MKLVLTLVVFVSSRSFYPKFGNSIVEYQPDQRVKHKFLPLRVKKSDIALDNYDHQQISQLLDEFFSDEGYDQVSGLLKLNPEPFQWQEQDSYDPTDKVLTQLGVKN